MRVGFDTYGLLLYKKPNELFIAMHVVLHPNLKIIISILDILKFRVSKEKLNDNYILELLS